MQVAGNTVRTNIAWSCHSEEAKQLGTAISVLLYIIIMKFELLEPYYWRELMNFSVNNTKFIKLKMQIIACITTNIFNDNVPC